MSEHGSWRLSPAYDVTFTVNSKNRFIGDRHTMSIEESDRLISRNQLLRFVPENDVRNSDLIIHRATSVVEPFMHKAEELSVDGFYTDLISNFKTPDSSISFLSFMKEHIDYLRCCNQLGTAKNYERAMQSLVQFSGGDIAIMAIDEQ